MDLPTLDDRAARLLDDVLAPHRAAVAALDDPDINSLAAVSWLAAHLAAAEECLYALARRRLPDGAAVVSQQLKTDRRLHEALWRLDRRLTGDVHHAHHAVEDLERAVRARLDEHASAEHALLEHLLAVLDDEERDALARRLTAALEHAPTRPHPHAPHPLWTGGALLRLEAIADRMRDLMDGREVPTPHQVRPPLPAGPWACYVMGRSYPTDAGVPGPRDPDEGGQQDETAQRPRHSRETPWSETSGP